MSPTLARRGRIAASRRRTSAAFSPTDITNLIGWYDAGQIAGATNTVKIASWPDMSGAGNNLTQGTSANQPAFYSSAAPAGVLPNGKPAVYFGLAGASTRMDSGALGDPAASTVFLLVQSYTSASPVYFDKAAAGTGRIVGYRPSGTQIEVFAGASLTGSLAGTAQPPAVLTFMANGASSQVRKDGTALATGNAGTNTLGSLRVGADQAGAAQLQGAISEVIVYSRALTTPELGQVETYLKTKYATA